MKNKILWLAIYDEGNGTDWDIFPEVDDYKKAEKTFKKHACKEFGWESESEIKMDFELFCLTSVYDYDIRLKK